MFLSGDPHVGPVCEIHPALQPPSLLDFFLFGLVWAWGLGATSAASEIIPGSALLNQFWGPYGIPGMEPQLASNKANILPAVLYHFPPASHHLHIYSNTHGGCR